MMRYKYKVSHIYTNGEHVGQNKTLLKSEFTVNGNYNGKMMLIDHGEGLMSAYSHLSKIYKSGGTWVEQGDFISR